MDLVPPSPVSIALFQWIDPAMPAKKSLALPGCYVVIPARLGSTRLPHKMMLRETGKTLIEHTYRAACEAKLPCEVIVATDHRMIADEVRSFGGRAVMTDPHCNSGTDRVAEVVRGLPDAKLVVNLQGDEPDINPTAVDEVIRLLASDPTLPMATLATPLNNEASIADSGCVKVVCDERGNALYFSRSRIPFVREPKSLPMDVGSLCHQHLGIYAYRREFLLEMASWQPSRLEKIEMLEQLRVLERARTIKVGIVARGSRGIDTPEDYAAFVARYAKQRAANSLAVA